MLIWAYLRRKCIFLPIQIIGILLITFIVVRMSPADPARIYGGTLVTEEGLELIRKRLGLTGSLPMQFFHYVVRVCKADLGISWVTGNPVITDIIERLPGTLELIIASLLVTFFIMVPMGIKCISGAKGFIRKIGGKVLFGYGMAAGAFPDFWLGLILIFIFYALLGWFPTPVGQLSPSILTPERITGMYVIDSLITGNWPALKSSIAHLILPVFVLVFVYGGAILKTALVSAKQVYSSEYINYARISGLPIPIIERYISKSTRLPVVTLTAFIFGFLIGGAVLVETVFNWAGFGQYAVQAIIYSDFAAIQGVVLISAIINLFIYVMVDLIYFYVDPRIRSLG